MKLLVTGGAGYIGSVVTHRLVALGHDVTILDNLSTGHADTIPAAATFVQADLHDVGDVLDPSFDGVLHFAARIAAGESVTHPELYWDTNIVGSLALLRAIRAAGVGTLVFSSTAAVYGSSDDPISERTPTAPANPYGASKLAVDTMITGECGASDLAAVSLRYFNAAGAITSPVVLGERHDPETHLIPIALAAAAGEIDHLKLYGTDYPTPDGTCVRDYIHVADLAEAHVLALHHAQTRRHRIFNLGTGTGYSNREVIDTVSAVTGKPIGVVEEPRRAGDAVIVVASAEKATRELGWRPERGTLNAIVSDAWAAYQARNN